MTAPAAVSPRQTRKAPIDSQQVRDLLERVIAFIPNRSFKSQDDQIDWLDHPALKSAEEGDDTAHAPQVKGLPAHLMRMCETPVMTSDEERAFFRRMNYLKFKANELRAKLKRDRFSPKQLSELQDLVDRTERIRNYIIRANVRLVMSIAKKFANVANMFDDMLSEGITSLMHAVEKFDFDRGFRFSTYATTSIQRDLYRLVQKGQKHRQRFKAGADDIFAASPEADSVEESESFLSQGDYSSLTAMIEELDAREKLIIRARFGFDAEGARKSTYTSLGKQLGISKERVRQLAERAIGKLRTMAPEFELASVDV